MTDLEAAWVATGSRPMTPNPHLTDARQLQEGIVITSDITKGRRTIMGRTIRGLVVGFGMTLVLGAPVAAGTSDSRYFERGHTAFASNEVCQASPDSDVVTCRALGIQVFSGRRGGTDPATRFTGYELNLSMSKTKSNEETGQILGQRFQDAHVVNSDALRVAFDGLRGASVEGTLRVTVTRCSRRGDCETSNRRIELDLDWTARPGPASESFSYYRQNDDGCEFTFTQTRRARDARMVGLIDGSMERAPGQLSWSDSQATSVCG